MTESAIVRKLRLALADAIDSECKVVYVLAEARKLLETYPRDPVPFALKLYCHWALHIDLDKPKTTLQFLERVDNYAASFFEGNKDISEERAMVREFVFLDTFRRQFKQLLSAYDLPTVICDENLRWHEFLAYYAGVIDDGSLSCDAKAHPLKLVKEVVFTKGKAAAPEENSYVPFGLAWNIVLLDGRTLTVEVTASPPDGNEMISLAASLH